MRLVEAPSGVAEANVALKTTSPLPGVEVHLRASRPLRVAAGAHADDADLRLLPRRLGTYVRVAGP